MRGLSIYIALGKPVFPSFAFVAWSHIRIAIGPIAVCVALHDLDRLFWSMAKKLKGPCHEPQPDPTPTGGKTGHDKHEGDS